MDGVYEGRGGEGHCSGAARWKGVPFQKGLGGEVGTRGSPAQREIFTIAAP